MKSTDNLGTFLSLIAGNATSGNVATIPQTQTTAGDGTASVSLGFPPETFIDRAAGGKPPRGADMNGLLRLLSQAVQARQSGYFGQYNAAFATAIGGYPAGAVLNGSAVGTFWVSTAENNVTVPGADGANWQSLFSGFITEDAADTRYVLSTGPKNAQSGIKIYIAWPTDETAKTTGYRPLLQVQADYIGPLALYSDIVSLDSSKVSKTGDTMTNQLTIATNSGLGINAVGQQVDAKGVIHSPAIKTGISDTSLAYLQYEFLSGKYARLGILVRDGDSIDEFLLTPDGRIKTFSGRTFAWLDDFPDLAPYAKKSDLPDLSPYALKSSSDSGPITGGHYVRNGNVLTQSFNTYLSTSGFSGTISFPISFSETPTCVLLTNSDDGDMDMWANRANWTANGCIVQTPQGKANGQISVYAQGLVS